MLNDGVQRCNHGYAAHIVVQEDGWHVPMKPGNCPKCPEGPCSIPYKPGRGVKAPVTRAPRKKIVECPEPGCIVVVTEGEPHKSPHLIPGEEPAATEDPEHIPIAVEISNSDKWHSPRIWTPDLGMLADTAVAFCGLKGVVTDSLDVTDLVDCKTCLRLRSKA